MLYVIVLTHFKKEYEMVTLELAQLSLKDGDLSHNLNKALESIENASSKTDIIIFPETYFSGFPTHDNIADLS